MLLQLALPAADPLVYYHLAHLCRQADDPAQAREFARQAAELPASPYFPNRLEDIAALQAAAVLNPADARAPYLLGNLWYDKRQYDDAIAQWELAAGRNPAFATVFRNLGIACFNQRHQPEAARAYFEKAFALDPTDARVFMELVQLGRRLGTPPAQQLALLEQHAPLVEVRDDLCLERVALYNQLDQPTRALELLLARQFHPWEGGEGKAAGQYLRCLVELAKAHLRNSRPDDAIELLLRALAPGYPHSLGEGKLPAAPENDVCYWLGCAHDALGQAEAARQAWQRATVGSSEPAAALFYNDQQPDQIFYQGLVWEKLGEPQPARAVFDQLLQYGQQHLADEVKLDYFAVSLPDLLIFDDDLNRRNALHCRYLTGLGYLGLGQLAQAKAAFGFVLTQDALHPGAHTHLHLADGR